MNFEYDQKRHEEVLQQILDIHDKKHKENNNEDEEKEDDND